MRRCFCRGKFEGVRKIRYNLLIICALLTNSVLVFGQEDQNGTARNALRIQLCSGFITVVKDASVDLDSSLVFASKYSGISRIPIILEGIDPKYFQEDLKWMDQRNPVLFEKKSQQQTGRRHAQSLFLLGAYFAFCPGLNTSYNDRAIKNLNQARSELEGLRLTNLTAHCLILIAKCYLKKGDTIAANRYLKSITGDKQLAGNKRLLAKAYTYAGTYYPYLPTTSKLRLGMLDSALKIYQELKDVISQVNILQNIGYLNFASGQPDKTAAAVGNALAIQRSIKFPYTHYSTDLLSFLAMVRANYPQQLAIALETVRTAEVTRDSVGLPYFYMRVGASYTIVGNHVAESNIWYNKSLGEFIKYRGDASLYRLFANQEYVISGFGGSKKLLGLLQDMLKNYPPRNSIQRQDLFVLFGACYEDIGEYKLAEKYYLSAESLTVANDISEGNKARGHLYSIIADFYIHIHNYTKAKFYISKYLSKNKGRGPEWIYEVDVYRALFKIDSAQGKFDAMKNLYRYVELRDKMYTNKKDFQLEELNVRYQTLQKQKDLAMYKAKNLLQQQQAKASSRVMYIGFASLFIIICFVLARFISKQKSNRQLSLQKDEINKKNSLLETVIREKDDLLISKEWLLKEVHHRVKNNLQLVMSLLNSQTNYLKDESAMKAVLESKHRVLAMSLIHQTLYSSENVSSIEMSDYIKTVVEYLQESYETKTKIYFEQQIEPLRLDISFAVPVGLILNELVTNAIKYAFPTEGQNRITISFFKSAEREITLIIADNGRGLPGDFNNSTTKSFGITLIRGLTEDLDGKLSMESHLGTTATLVFEYSEIFKKVS